METITPSTWLQQILEQANLVEDLKIKIYGRHICIEVSYVTNNNGI